MTVPAGETWPSVTAVVPTRDRPALLQRALAAIRGQDYPGPLDCVVVFDQASPVDLGGDARVPTTGITNARTPGLAGARNSGAEAAKGELLAFCDDDDEWLPHKLRAQVSALRRHPGSAVVASGVVVHYGSRSVVRLPPRDVVTLQDLIRSRMSEIHPSTLVVRRAFFLEEAGPVDEAIPGSYGEDYEWLLRASAAAPLVAVRQPLVRIHWHPSSWFAARWQTMAEAIPYLIRKHPELAGDRHGLARLYGRLAFAHAAAGDRAQARRWALRSLGLNRRDHRAYLALAVSTGVVRAETLVGLANRVGRGI